MATDQNDLLLELIADRLKEIKDEIVRRFPEPVEVNFAEPKAGPRQVVVTGEGAGEGPSQLTAKKAAAKKPAAKPH